MENADYIEMLNTVHALPDGLTLYLKSVVKSKTYLKGQHIDYAVDNQMFYPLMFTGAAKLLAVHRESGERINLYFYFDREFLFHATSCVINPDVEIVLVFLEDAELMYIEEVHYGNVLKLYGDAYHLDIKYNMFHFEAVLNQLFIRNYHLATQRYQLMLKDNPKTGKRLSVNDIASYLGIDQKTLSRIRTKE
ncbi:hypothetical protein [Pedobacter sp. BMA]|uniref:hypothetical protein n=1 Tax=Pedobacter sp. BMA TaxID=1663685 RepID=UPI00064B713D|nr:hypothetical protein [Pedobacter sp. BMA]KLT64036.1 hypothetical protein AB669_18400 [Pedobacter sp. BMA]